jgi:hypothetical protein
MLQSHKDSASTCYELGSDRKMKLGLRATIAVITIAVLLVESIVCPVRNKLCDRTICLHFVFWGSTEAYEKRRFFAILIVRSKIRR